MFLCKCALSRTAPLLFPPLLSYSMILVEIATRSYLSAVSVLAGFEDYNRQPSLDICLFASGGSSKTGPRRRDEDGYHVAPPSA